MKLKCDRIVSQALPYNKLLFNSSLIMCGYRNGYIKASCCYGCAALGTSASVASGLTVVPCCSQPTCDLFGLLDILVRRAPEEQAAGHPANCEQHPQLSGDAQEAVFHGGRTGALRKRDTDRVGIK